MDDEVQEAVNGLKDDIAKLQDQVNQLNDVVGNLTNQLSDRLDKANESIEDAKSKAEAASQPPPDLDDLKHRADALERYVRDLAQAINTWPAFALASDSAPGAKMPVPPPTF